MNFARTSTTDDENKVSVTFNQESTSLAVGTKYGFRLYDIKDIDQLQLIHEDNSDYTFIVERLFSSSLLAIVNLSAPRKLKICHFKKKIDIIQYSYCNTILAVKLNRLRLIVCLEENIFIHNIKDLNLVHSIKHVSSNPNGIIALAPSNERCYLAYPARNTIGEVNIFDADKLEDKLTIAAHDNPLVSLTFDSQGIKLATASEKGTVIRVFSTLTGECIYEFRRGYARCVSIYSLSFSSDSKFLCASSNTETVHIFKLTEIKTQDDPSVTNYLKKFCQSASYFNPVAEIMNQWRSFATVKLPLCGSRSICTITNSSQNNPNVLIATTDGFLYAYDLNTVDGGDCTLMRQHNLIDFGNKDSATLAGNDTVQS
ncbi:WD repeat domain phosphoinositide-interacting protein 2 [Sarcoptes scabiei]|uniref:WD repeat domain phosphoinositide-interacting protein 2 n=1 Tax=Sarcoptes scabiei TaxID=52283 RepID=A0A834R1H4_SARSC|nr:WD repeat domain phosphoinositide-interacting protein 2 [Sarcoptes scabiei]UXI14720.1 C2 domain-containing protein 5 [Sarcoptes scabiei]